MITSFEWKKALVVSHRWLGIAGGVLVVLWFGSGIVMMYARMPALDAAEQRARAPTLDASSVAVAPADAARTAGASPAAPTLAMLAARPVYRFGTTVVFADTGEPLRGLAHSEALALADSFSPGHRATLAYEGFLTEPDQWTLQNRAFLPLHRIDLGDPEGTRLYVSDRTGQVVMRTTRSGRRWAYVGAVLHWLYFTPFRVHTNLWAQTIIWLSVLGCLLTLTGLAWGAWRFTWRSGGRSPRSPYSGLLRWHHYTGLLFGFFTFTWILSGGLSMDPWSWHPGTTPTASQEAAVRGEPLRLDAVSADDLRSGLEALPEGRRVKEVRIVQLHGEMYLRAITDASVGGSLLVPAEEPQRGAFERFSDASMLAAARAAMPDVAIQDHVWLEEYDDYYYARGGASPALPVLRVRYTDPQRTWLYFDPALGAVVRKEERLTRLNRWLYHGLHSLDFPFLYRSRPLWDVVVIVLSLGGLTLAATTLLPGWRRVARHARKIVDRRP